MKHRIQIETSAFNERRYGKPWIALVTFSPNIEGDFEWGTWVGDVRNGTAGVLEIEAETGAIVATGQKDLRKPRNSAPEWFQVSAEGKLLPLSTKAEALREFRNNEGFKRAEELAKQVPEASAEAFQVPASPLDLSNVTDEILIAELTKRGFQVKDIRVVPDLPLDRQSRYHARPMSSNRSDFYFMGRPRTLDNYGADPDGTLHVWPFDFDRIHETEGNVVGYNDNDDSAYIITKVPNGFSPNRRTLPPKGPPHFPKPTMTTKKTAKKLPAKKAAKKAVAKKATKKATPTPKPAAKKTARKGTPNAAKKAVTKPVTPKKAAKKTATPAVRSDKPIDGDRPTKNGVTRPAASSIAGQLWEIADRLREKLGRSPARFEFRAAVVKANEKRAAKGQPELVPASVSFQFFKWRTHHGIAAREAGFYPKRNTFDLSIPTRIRKPKDKTAPAPVKKVAKKSAKTEKPATKKATPPAKKTAVKVAAKKVAPVAKKAAKKVAKKTAPKSTEPAAEAPTVTPDAPVAPPVSSRLAAASQAAAATTETEPAAEA